MPPSQAGAGTPAPTVGDVVRIALSGAAPDAIVLDGATAWVLAGEGGSLMEVDLAARRELRAIDVGFGATHLALPDPGVAAVARFDNSGSGRYLLIVDLATGAIEGVATGALGAMALGEDGIVWALEKADRLLKVDTRTKAVVGEAPVQVGENVHIEVQSGAGSAWVGSDGMPMERLSGASLEPEGTIAVDEGIPFLVEDGHVWGAGPGQLWSVDPATNEVTRRIQLDNLIEILALDIDDNDAWLGVRHPGYVGAVLHVDLASGEVVEEFPVTLPAAVRIAGDRVWVASYLTNELLGFER